ncbi:hypothetical protein AZH53_05115 [Methanomicrobiaceae archaeon CYW5]|nr:hypothetical protein [Methanovulcanius yangii]
MPEEGSAPLDRCSEPETGIFDTPGNRYITIELPGIDHEDIRFAVDGSELHIAADGREMMFRNIIPLDGMEPDSLRYTFRNGIPEFSLRNISGKA